jgi:hypothetical protein
LDDLANRIDHPDLGACADDMLVLKNIGSRGESGMPEAGYWPIPKTPARQGQGHAEDLRWPHQRHGVRTDRAA